MKKHIHGGNVYDHAGCIDFSANCNPLGTPESVIRAGEAALREVFQYPQVGYAPLREAIAAYEGVDSSQVICGNGAAELIFTLCRALSPKRALLLAPTFAEYEEALCSVGCEVKKLFLKEEEGFRLGTSYLEALTPEIDLAFLCNPNNPTGCLISHAFLLEILEKCRENGIFLVVDECFLDFVKEPASYTLKDVLPGCENLFLLKAFTKRYAMAGIRLGYGLCDNGELLSQMERCVQPWNLSTIAQRSGIAALQETSYVEEARELIFKEKEYLRNAMEALSLRVFDSEANYIFFQGPAGLYEKCLEKGILIRDCANYAGLSEGYYRVAVKLHWQNEKLIQALEELWQR